MIAMPQPDKAVYAGAGARAGVEIPLWSMLRLRLSGDVLGTLQPTTARIDGRAVWKTFPVNGALGGGVVADFGGP
jgi:hypothetical protein